MYSTFLCKYYQPIFNRTEDHPYFKKLDDSLHDKLHVLTDADC